MIVPTIYLGGPIAGCDDNEAKEWRAYVKSKEWQYNNWRFHILDPMRRDFRGKGLANRSDVMKDIVEFDKIDICQSDALLVNLLPDKEKTGTNMEIIYAWERGKLNVLVLPPDKRISPWHRYHSQKIVHTLDDGIDYIVDYFK